jgi:GNAT superfamily N-acetyltransferase
MPEKVVCSTMLRDGQELSISVATHPLSRRLINAFLRTPEMSSTRRESRRRLYGGLRGQSSDYFFTGGIGENTVGTLWYCTPEKCKELAYLGEVFTNKKYRNKGVATGLLETAIDHFGKEGGRAIYVTNLCPHAPRRIYRKLGFQAYGFGQQAYGGIIRLLVCERSEDFDRDYYEYDSNVCIRSVNRGDLPHFIALLNYRHEWIIRAYSLGLIGPVVFDELGRSFTDLMETLKTSNICVVLENGKKRVVGTAYSSLFQPGVSLTSERSISWFTPTTT